MNDRPTSADSARWDHETDAGARRRYRALVDVIDDGIYQLDADGYVVAANDAFLELTGYARDDLIGAHVSSFVDGDAARLTRGAGAERDEDGPATAVLTVRTGDDDRIPCEFRVRAFEADEECTGTIGVARPVSEEGRDQVGESGRGMETPVIDVLDEANIGAFVLNDAFDVVWADETVGEYFGVDRDELLGHDKGDVLETIADRVESPGAFRETVLETYEDNTTIERFECRVTGAGDTDRWLEHWSKPIESGQYAGGRIELYYDITDRKRSEGALVRSETEFASLVDAVEEYAIFRLDTDGRVVSWNEGASKIKGYDRSEILGEHFSNFYTEADRDAGVPERNLATAAATGEAEDEGWRVRQDGSRFWANVTITAIRGDDGELQGFAKVTRDMTDRREREQRLQRERDLFDRLLQTSPVGLTVFDPNGSTVRSNDRMAEVLGLSEGTMASYTMGDIDLYDGDGEFVPVDDRPVARVLETGESVTNVELQLPLGDGQSRWLSVNATPVTDDDGTVRHVVLAATDVTPLKVQARRLERQRNDLRTELDELFERIDDAFYAVDTEWRITYANEAFADLVDVSRADLLGMDLWEVVPSLTGTEFAELVRQAMDTGDTIEYEVFYEPQRVWFQAAVYPSETGQSVYLKDITNRKRARTRLQRRAKQQRIIAQLGQSALETSNVDDLMADAAARVADVLDNAYCKVLDLDPRSEELLLRQGVGWDDGVVGSATVNATEASQASYTLQSDGPVVVEDMAAETRFSGPDLLENHDVESGVSTIIGSVDDPWGVLGVHDTETKTYSTEDVNFVQSVANILADAIERKEYQRELEETIARLEASNERLEQFAYAASHDLQEPLRMVASYLRLIEARYEDRLDEDGREFLTFAVDGADRMREMIDGLLQYSRIDTQGEPLEPVDAEAVVEDVLADLEVRIAETDAEITVDPLPRVWADESQLRQVFQNLLTNALTYAGDEPPRVHVTAERDGAEWILSVSDEGIGIDTAHAEEIFDVFNRAHSRAQDTGTGIGLAICERILERHDGDIWVESDPGEGATFSFTLTPAESGPG